LVGFVNFLSVLEDTQKNKQDSPWAVLLVWNINSRTAWRVNKIS
jgi:hypothetical protein